MSHRTLIVGASHAGIQLAASLRDDGDEGAITVVGAERRAPYHRPPLSKAFLAGSKDLASLELRAETFYSARGIEVITGEHVKTLEVGDGHREGRATTENGAGLAFDRLALTVGARPRRLDIPGVDLEGVSYLRDADDALSLIDHLQRATSVVVVGGGFIGLEVASIARDRGLQATIVEIGPDLIPRTADPILSRFLLDAHRRRGAVIELGTGIRALHGEGGRVGAVELGDGRTLPAEVVVVGIGIVPNTDLAEAIGLRCENGIVVDEYARTSEPGIVAAGDCTSTPNPMTGSGRVRLESMPHAVSQARTAAATLMGQLAPYDEIPWFWSDQYDLKVQMAGLSTGHDQQIVRGDPASERFSVLSYRRDRLISVSAVNNPTDYMAAKAAMARRIPMSAQRAADAALPLKQLLAEATAPLEARPIEVPLP